MARKREALAEAAIPQPATPSLTPESLAGFRVTFARDVMMAGIHAALSRANFTGLDLEAQSEFAVKAANALIAELCRND